MSDIEEELTVRGEDECHQDANGSAHFLLPTQHEQKMESTCTTHCEPNTGEETDLADICYLLQTSVYDIEGQMKWSELDDEDVYTFFHERVPLCADWCTAAVAHVQHGAPHPGPVRHAPEFGNGFCVCTEDTAMILIAHFGEMFAQPMPEIWSAGEATSIYVLGVSWCTEPELVYVFNGEDTMFHDSPLSELEVYDRNGRQISKNRFDNWSHLVETCGLQHYSTVILVPQKYSKIEN